MGNTLPLFRRWRVRIDPVSNKLGDTFSTLGRHYKPISSHNRAARHSRATLQPQSVPQQCHATLSGNITAPKTFPNSSARHPWATLQAYIVPQQFCAAPSGNTLPLFRRWRVRIEAVLNKPGDSFSTLGRRFKPTSFHNRAMRHSRATLQPLNVPQQFCATPLGNITASKCSPTEPRDTLGRRYSPKTFPQQFCAAPLGDVTSPHRSPTEPRDTLGQHFATFSPPKRTH